MFVHNKRLQYTVRVAEPNPTLASLLLEQFGGPQGELAAAMRYFSQALAESDPGRKDMLLDIATEELSHLEVIGSAIVMLTKGVKGKLAEGAADGELLAELTQGGESHTLSLLHGGLGLVNSAGVPWTAAYVDTIGEPTADLRSNIAAESRAKIIYERLVNCTDDPGLKEALSFLMTREVAHQKSFEKALYAIEPNFPPGKMPPMPEFENKYFNLSQGEGDMEGPWNTGPQWERVDVPEPAVDGGDGMPSVKLPRKDQQTFDKAAARTASRTDVDPATGAELGMATASAPSK
ncbi:MAG TPA: manganese catalase family protein [Stellaceae bacterium]|jgi:Mn-containing catalase|nr:manganese catalase family protein [Stellaceae bacterium]